MGEVIREWESSQTVKLLPAPYKARSRYIQLVKEKQALTDDPDALLGHQPHL